MLCGKNYETHENSFYKINREKVQFYWNLSNYYNWGLLGKNIQWLWCFLFVFLFLLLFFSCRNIDFEFPYEKRIYVIASALNFVVLGRESFYLSKKKRSGFFPYVFLHTDK